MPSHQDRYASNSSSLPAAWLLEEEPYPGEHGTPVRAYRLEAWNLISRVMSTLLLVFANW